MKEKKDLSLVYALKEYARVNGGGGPIIEDNRCFTFDDIKAAFNAGRERVFNDFPKLLYNEDGDNSLAVDIFNNVCLIIKLKGDSRYKFVVAYKESTQLYDTLEEAKQAANEDYKKRIKQALGL